MKVHLRDGWHYAGALVSAKVACPTKIEWPTTTSKPRNVTCKHCQKLTRKAIK